MNESMDMAHLHDGLRFLQTTKTFVGREFLTWLWFLAETRKHVIQIPDLGEFKFYIDDRIVLSSSGGSVHENALRGGTPAYANEAHLALLSGKLVQEAKFILQDEESRQWMWSMKADDFALRSVRLPSVQEADPAAHISARIRLMQVLNEFVGALFQNFMDLRMSPQKYQKELDNIQDWLTERQRL